MDDADIAEKDYDTMFAEWQRKRMKAERAKSNSDEPRRCINCNKIIPTRRLIAVPDTNYCVDCLRSIENGSR